MPPWPAAVERPPPAVLKLGVVLLFVLSGFLLAGPWVASGLDERPAPRLARFALKRTARVAPAYGGYLWHLPVLLWLGFEGLLAHGFAGAWIEVAALSVGVAIASWVLVERPGIEAAGRWRPWTRRVPSVPADRHIRPVPSVA